MIIPNSSNRIGFIYKETLTYPYNSTVIEVEITDQYRELSFYQATASSINWGDGTEDNLTSHTYTQNGTYIVELKGNTALRVMLNTSNFTINKVIKLSNLQTNCAYMFSGCINLTSLSDDFVIPNSATSCFYMFDNCGLIYLPDNFVIPNSVINCQCMFIRCKKLISLGCDFKFGNSIENCRGLFFSCESLINVKLNIPNSVINLYDCFSGCKKLTTLDLSNSVINLLANIDRITYGCISISEAYAIDQETCDRLNDTDKADTWQFVVK